MSEMFLDVALIDHGGRCEARAQAMPGKQRQILGLRQLGPDPTLEHTRLGQASDMLVAEAGLKGAITRCAHEERTKPNFGKVKPLLQRVDKAGLVAGAAADFDLAPAGLGVECESRALVEEFDPVATVRGVVLAEIQADDF